MHNPPSDLCRPVCRTSHPHGVLGVPSDPAQSIRPRRTWVEGELLGFGVMIGSGREWGGLGSLLGSTLPQASQDLVHISHHQHLPYKDPGLERRATRRPCLWPMSTWLRAPCAGVEKGGKTPIHPNGSPAFDLGTPGQITHQG